VSEESEEDQMRLVITHLESEVAALRHDIERATQRNSDLLAEVEGMREDAERWRTLPAFLEKHQINYVMLLDDIDLARKESSNG